MAARSGAILIVEDSVDDLRVIQDVLEKAGIQNPIGYVHTVTDAIALLGQMVPDNDPARHPPVSVILLDLKLPGRDGFQLLEWLRNRPEFKDVLTVVISGFGDLASIRRSYDLGADSFLTKPCNLLDLENLIQWFPEYWQHSMQQVSRADAAPMNH